MTIADFRRAADSLNGTDRDLRIDGGARRDRYDPGSIDRWLQHVRADQNNELHTTVSVRASWDGELWTLHAPDLDVSVTNPRLMAAQRMLAAKLSSPQAMTGTGISFDVAYSSDHPAMRAFTSAEELRMRAEKLLERGSTERFEALRELKLMGMTDPEIAAVARLSHQRIQQIRTRPPSLTSEDPARQGYDTDVGVDSSAGRTAQQRWDYAEGLRAEAADMLQRAFAERLGALQELKQLGLTTGETAAMLGLTHGLVQEILTRSPSSAG